MRIKLLIFLALICTTACQRDKQKIVDPKNEKPLRVVNVPAFNSDSAYYFIQKQVSFGPRIPNTQSHKKAGDFLIDQLKKYGAQVTVQSFKATTYDGQTLNLRNIIATYFPEKQKRILLAAHWDTRPFADKDKEKPNVTFDGANDGGSGVGVLLDVARILSKGAGPQVGIDIIFFDGEDWGEKENEQNTHPLPKDLADWWCLGSQYWAKNKHKSNYAAYYGILLDMVGAKNAQFPKEGGSMRYAPSIVNQVWNTANRLGYGHIFINQNQPELTDDHRFVSEIGKIPMIDIVHYDQALGYFGDFHHTRKDNMDIISKETLKAVGETVLHVIYYEE
ncbi:MAG: M28 family peptidase [Bacteroidota bacterium]